MTWGPLPDVLASVEVPTYFHPSTFRQLSVCRLSVLAPATARDHLPPRPLALLGTLLHHCMGEVGEGRWGAEIDPKAAFDRILEQATGDVEVALAARGWPRLTPLAAAVGAQRWAERARRARRWAVRDAAVRSNGPPRPMVAFRPVVQPAGSESAFVGSGREARIVWPAGRIRGQADRLDRPAGGPVRIVEFKTGEIEGKGALESATLQVGLYALAVQAVIGGDVELLIEADEVVRIAWPATRPVVQRALEEALRDLPAGEVLASEALARVGPHCRNCDLRPVCGSYLRTAPELWGASGTGGQMPLDVWGTVIRVGPPGGLLRVEILDASGSLVVVDRVRLEAGSSPPTVGATVHFFDLATDEAPMHAERTRPSNLRDEPRAGASVRRPAWGFQAFIDR